MQTVCVVVVVGVGVVGDAGQKLRGAADDVLATELALSRPLPPSTGLLRFRYKVGQPSCDPRGQGLCPGPGLCSPGDGAGR